MEIQGGQVLSLKVALKNPAGAGIAECAGRLHSYIENKGLCVRWSPSVWTLQMQLVAEADTRGRLLMSQSCALSNCAANFPPDRSQRSSSLGMISTSSSSSKEQLEDLKWMRIPPWNILDQE